MAPTVALRRALSLSQPMLNMTQPHFRFPQRRVEAAYQESARPHAALPKQDASDHEAHDPHKPKAGMGLGNIRGGLDAVHRVEVPTPTFLAKPKTVSLIGAPLTLGQPFAGTDQGPQALRKMGLLSAAGRLGWRVEETGDLTFDTSDDGPEYTGPGNCRNNRAVGKACEKLKTAVQKNAARGRFVLTLGGDHSIALGSIAGILSVRPNTGIVWVDAHADINTPLTSPSGNMHGMPLGLLMKIFDTPSIPGLEWMASVPTLQPSQIAYVGLRDVDKGEREILRRYNIPAYTMYHVDKYGIGKVMEMLLDHLGNRPLHMSYDIDACDPAIAPSTGTRVRGGLSYREAHFIAESVAETGRLGSVDLVEVNPSFHNSSEEQNDDTLDLGFGLLTDCLGNRIL